MSARALSLKVVAPILCALVATMLCSLAMAAPSSTRSREDRIDSDSVKQAADALQTDVEAAIRHAGGDISKQNVHLVLGFSTGNFSSDPLGAQAARDIGAELASRIVRDTDLLSVYAYEMDLWDYPGPRSGSFHVNDSSRDSLRDLFPLTPQQNSPGGHDTEKAIVRITERLGQARDAVIVLITNSAASVSAPGLKVIGANSEEYHKVLQNWHRMPQVSMSGASRVLKFSIATASGQVMPRTLDAVVIVPRSFSGRPYVPGVLAAPGSPSAAETTGGSSVSLAKRLVPILALIAALALLGIVLTKSRRKPAQMPVPLELEMRFGKSEPRVFALKGIPVGEEICYLAGPGYVSSDDRGIEVTSRRGAPAKPIASCVRSREGVTAVLKLDSWEVLADGEPMPARFEVKQGEPCRICLSGLDDTDAKKLPTRTTIEIDVHLRPTIQPEDDVRQA